MKNKFYSIKEVATILDIEAYVLRYYEKELELDIPRNTQGHRIYATEEIEVLRQVKELREQGLELKAIRNVIHTLDEEGIESLMHIGTKQARTVGESNQAAEGNSFENVIDITDKENAKVQQFSLMMKDMFKQALVEYQGNAKEQLKEELTEEMDVMLHKKIREIQVEQEEKNEEYYNKIDETMREMQRLRKSIAELEQSKEKTSLWKKLFGAKNEDIEEKSM